MSYTPGPWIAVSDRDVNGQLVRVAIHTNDEAHVTIAFIEIDNCADAVALADARAIAAVPDLHEACRRAIPWLGKLIASGEHNNAMLPRDAVRTLEMLEAAIMKAEGQED